MEASITFVTRGKLFRDETGQPVRVNGLIWDITERKRAEEEKEKLEAELRQAQKLEAIGTLAGGIAHDFNNILQPMIGYTEMALSELSPSDPVREDLEQVLNASLRAKELVRQILAISRSTQEQQRIPIDISSIIKEALKLLRSSLPTSIEMRQKIRKGVALADPTQIHQVLMNLCTNAAHAMADKGILEVRLSPVDLSESDLADQHIVDLKPGPYLRVECFRYRALEWMQDYGAHLRPLLHHQGGGKGKRARTGGCAWHSQTARRGNYRPKRTWERHNIQCLLPKG